MNSESEKTVRVAGARADSLLGYLRGIAIFRLTSAQLDAGVRASWENGSMVLHGIERDRLVQFLLEDYAPTPVLNPWNSGAGFDAKSKVQEAGKALDRLDCQQGARWSDYREALRGARQVLEKFGDSEVKDAKAQIVSRLRSTLSDRALEWIDAAVLIGKESVGFPIILGTGGNDGRLDFSINFLKRVLDVIGDRALDTRKELLLDALEGTSRVPLPPGILGQYQLGAGSYNNPWDLVFAIEGAIAFAGSITRRFNSDGDRPAAPFQFTSISAGYASASDQEEDRGELWLPQWRGAASFAALRSVLRNGRVALVTPQAGATRDARVLGATAAADSIAAVQAAQTLGVSSGISSFSRIVIAQRNGLAFGATYVGQIAVSDRSEIAVLARDVRAWVVRVSRLELGAAAQAALREYQEGLLSYAARPSREAFCAMLAALADLDDSMAFARKNELKPLPWLSSKLHYDLDAMEHETVEDRIARSFSSVGSKHRKHRLRYRISHVQFDETKSSDAYDAGAKSIWHVDPREAMKSLFARATRAASIAPADQGEGFAARFTGSRGLLLDDFATIAAGDIDWRRFRRRLRAYSIVEPYVWPERRAPSHATPDVDRGGHATARVPVAFAALKTLVYGYLPRTDVVAAATEHATYIDAETSIQLVADTEPMRLRSLSGAYARLRNAGADVRDFRRATIEAGRTGAYALGLLTPAARATREALWERCRLDHTNTSHTLSEAALRKEIE
jgi:CRISPR-associated protein Csx17